MTNPELNWKRSQRCNAANCCVEVAVDGDEYLVRDSKNPDTNLRFTQDEWVAFVKGVNAGEFNL